MPPSLRVSRADQLTILRMTRITSSAQTKSPEQDSALHVRIPIKLPNDIARTGLVLLAAYVAILMFLAGFGSWLILSERDETIARTRERLVAHNRVIAGHLSRAIEEVDRALSGLAALAVERGGVETIDPATLGGYAKARQRTLPQVRSILITDSMGHIVAETSGFPVAAETQAKWAPVLQGLASELNLLVVGRPAPQLSPNALLVPISRRLPVLEGISGGSVVAAVDTGYFMRAFQDFGLPDGLTIAVDHNNGYRLLEYAQSKTGANNGNRSAISVISGVAQILVIQASPIHCAASRCCNTPR